ncbi:hypothetical protein DXG01_010069 [Tephrocybe rancida]|nr:hypothetical protein DXG01_010069 [Tephrocybe rancida]
MASVADLPPPDEDILIDESTGRPTCVKCKTWKLLELLPDPPAPITLAAPTTPPPEDNNATPPLTIQEVIWDPVRTDINTFGLYHEYPSEPTYHPDDSIALADMTNYNCMPGPTVNTPRLAPDTSIPILSELPNTPSLPPTPTSSPESHAPFRNSSIFGIMNWMWTGSVMKSVGEVTKLEDIMGFDIKAETTRYDDTLEAHGKQSSVAKDGWTETDVKIEVPYGKSPTPEAIPTFEVLGLHFRKIVEVIKSAVCDGSAACYHYTPFKQFWKSGPDHEPEQVYDDMFSSDAFIAEHIKLQQKPREPG